MKKTSKEDYLRVIYHLSEENKSEEVSSGDIQKYLNISKSSVSEMMGKLSKNKLIQSKPYQKIRLTKKGKSHAIQITRKHRIIEVFLKEILKIKDKGIHEEAHKLEHAFSEDSINSIYEMIKNKNCCPHGKEIPEIKGN